MRNIIFAIIAVFGFINSNAQQKVILEYNDGRIVKGTLKKFESDAKVIKIRDSKKKKLKVKSKDLAKISIIFKNDTAVFKKEKWANLSAFYKLKNKKNPVWLTKFYKSDAIDGYIGYSTYTTFNNTNRGLHSRYHGSINYYIKRPRDKRPILIAQNVTEKDPLHAFDTIMRRKFKSLVKKRCPKFVKLLKKKKYKIEDIETMFDDYNKTCGN